MKIDLTQFLEKEDETIEIEAGIDISSVTITGSEFSRIDDEKISLTFFNSEGKNLYVSGKTVLKFMAECDRCLSEFEREYSYEFSHICVRGHSDNDDYIIVEDNSLDLDETAISDSLLQLPTKILCREDCRGLCYVCGQNLNEGECDCS